MLLPKLLDEISLMGQGPGNALHPSAGANTNGARGPHKAAGNGARIKIGREGGATGIVPSPVRQYAAFTVRLAGVLFLKLPHVLCSGTTVMVDRLIGLLLECKGAAPSEVCEEVPRILLGLGQVSESARQTYVSAVKKLFQMDPNAGRERSPFATALMKALCLPRQILARQVVIPMILPRLILPLKTQRPPPDQRNNALVACIALADLDFVVKGMRSPSGDVEVEDMAMITDHILPVLALAALRCLGQTGHECTLAKELVAFTHFVLIMGVNVHHPSVPHSADHGTSRKSVLQVLANNETRHSLLLQALGTAYLHRTHATLQAGAIAARERATWADVYKLLKLNLDLEKVIRTNWPCSVDEVRDWPKPQRNDLPDDAAPAQRTMLKALPHLMSIWTKVEQQSLPLQFIGRCIDALANQLAVAKALRSGVLTPLQKEFAEVLVPKCKSFLLC
jgi:hypothetical protein